MNAVTSRAVFVGAARFTFASLLSAAATANPCAQIVPVGGGLMCVPDAINPPSAPTTAKPTPWRMMSRPEGIELVIDSTKMADSPSAASATAAAPAVQSTFNNGVAERVAPSRTQTTPVSPNRGAFVEERLPNGAIRLSLPMHASATTTAQQPAFPIVDVDARGQTLSPADAARPDVLLRRTP